MLSLGDIWNDTPCFVTAEHRTLHLFSSPPLFKSFLFTEREDKVTSFRVRCTKKHKVKDAELSRLQAKQFRTIRNFTKKIEGNGVLIRPFNRPQYSNPFLEGKFTIGTLQLHGRTGESYMDVICSDEKTAAQVASIVKANQDALGFYLYLNTNSQFVFTKGAFEWSNHERN